MTELKLSDEKYEAIAEFYEALMLVKDPYNHHGEKVANLARDFALSLGEFNATRIKIFYWGGRLHDIGKVFLPDELMNLPRRLTRIERDSIKSHAELGSKLLEAVHADESVSRCARCHHEDWSGTGYYGAKGEDIPESARLIRIVDTYDALTSKRAYRDGMSHEFALNYISAQSGIIFDPTFAEAFVKYMENKNG